MAHNHTLSRRVLDLSTIFQCNNLKTLVLRPNRCMITRNNEASSHTRKSRHKGFEEKF